MCIICSATDFRKINWIQYMMAMVFPNGRVIFIIRSDFQTTCSLNMTSFPFDSQTCYVDMCLQMYPANNVNLTTGIKSGVCGFCTQYRYIQCYVERVKRLCYVETRDKHILAHSFLNIQLIFNPKTVLES